MAFTAIHYPTDKDQGQLSYWPDNAELGVASENFFDQFIIYDAADPTALGGSGAVGDLLEDPPSPSILLDSLEESLNKSSSAAHDTQSDRPQADVAAAELAPLEIPPITSSLAAAPEQSKSVPLELADPLVTDPVLGGGSISDSELLRLEGISLKSPKANVTAPPSPPFPNTASLSPRKHHRVLDSIYATFRRATHRSKPHKLTDTIADLFRSNEEPCYDLPDGLDVNGFIDTKMEEGARQGPVDSQGLPLSPPLTGRMPPAQQHSNNDMMDFVSGHLDDPFYDGLLGPPAVINPAPSKNRGANDHHTPMDTPAMSDDAFYQHLMETTASANSYSRPQPQPKHRSTSSAEWPMEGILTNENTSNTGWPSTSPGTATAYLHEAGSSMPSPGWWGSPSHVKGGHHQHLEHSNSRSHTRNGLHGGAPASLGQISLHGGQQHIDMPYDYPPTTPATSSAEISGLMIHMPQPRAPAAPVLTSTINDAFASPPTLHGYHTVPPPPPAGAHRYPSSSSSSSHHGHAHHSRTSERRPRPRAPSSGARHHQSSHVHGSMSSPRKATSYYALREESASPTPTVRHRSSSSSLAVRKRRSWSRRHHPAPEPRTPSGAAPSGRIARSGSYDHGSISLDGNGSNLSVGGGGAPLGGGGGGGGLSIEFLNYTPNDKKVLMNGVAPSGSSKTKARREREAEEKRRKMGEEVMQAIRSAGGNVDELRRVFE
ncbi:hypothetical protein AAE478_006431 [Parahypoxylon ruwenzoriense]